MAVTRVSYSMVQAAPANIIDFGAVADADGINPSPTDNTAAVQAAINSFGTDRGCVYIPPGCAWNSENVNYVANVLIVDYSIPPKQWHIMGSGDDEFGIASKNTNYNVNPAVRLHTINNDGKLNTGLLSSWSADITNPILMWYTQWGSYGQEYTNAQSHDHIIMGAQTASVNAGTATTTNGSKTVTISGATLNADMVNALFVDRTDGYSGMVESVNVGAGTITLYSNYAGPGGSGHSYYILGGAPLSTYNPLRIIQLLSQWGGVVYNTYGTTGSENNAYYAINTLKAGYVFGAPNTGDGQISDDTYLRITNPTADSGGCGIQMVAAQTNAEKALRVDKQSDRLVVSDGVANPVYFAVASNASDGGEIFQTKSTSTAVAPGDGLGMLRWEVGTNAGTLKLVAYSGTSTTGVTIVDNVGSGNS